MRSRLAVLLAIFVVGGSVTGCGYRRDTAKYTKQTADELHQIRKLIEQQNRFIEGKQ